MSEYNIIISTRESTVVTEYEPKGKRSDAYQSEAALEKAFIQQLSGQGYEYLQIHDSEALVANLRKQLEKLNSYTFTENEWQRFSPKILRTLTKELRTKAKRFRKTMCRC